MYTIKRLLKKLFLWLHFYSHNSLLWKRRFSYTKEPKTVDILWTHIDTLGFIIVPIDILCAGILTPSGLRMNQLEDTPQYKFIKDIIEQNGNSDSRAQYQYYIKTFFPDNNTEQEMDKIEKMVSSFKEDHRKKIDNTDIVTYLPKYSREKDSYSIALCDGIHRVSIAKILGYKSIKCRLILETLKY